jgi:putative ABC transport system permease protein
VFVKSDNGGLLNSGFYLYSPSGLYPASDSWNSKDLEKVMNFGANIEIANKIISNNRSTSNNELINSINEIYEKCAKDNQAADWDELMTKVGDLMKLISNTFGQSAYVQTVSNVFDKLGQQAIYDGLSQTVNALEVAVLTCVILLVSIIVVLISSMLINNSKKFAAVLKSLGYSDASNLQSFLAVFIPTILIGLVIAIPLSILLVMGFNSIIFNVGGVLLLSNIK